MQELGVAAHARRAPDETAIVAGDARISYGVLDDRANRAANALAALGVDRGARIALALRNRAEAFEILTGSARLGADVVPISWRAMAGEVRYLLEDSGATLIVCEDDLEIGSAQALRMSEYEHAIESAPASPRHGAPDPAPTLLRFYTSGTTGRPKAVERPPRRTDEYLDSVVASCSHLGVTGTEQVHLCVGPLYHSGPLSYAVYSLLLGQTLVLPARFDPAETLRLIEAERVTWTFMVPIHFVRILALPPAERARDLSSVRRLLHAAAPCPPDVKRAIIDIFPPGTVWEFYGATEGRATVITAEEWLQRPGSVGRAIDGVTVRIMNEAGAELPPGDVGLVYMSPVGDVRFAYAGDPEKTAAAWRGDLFTVGDMGYMDSGGYLFLTDRAQDLIISGGSNVYPAEVEAVLHRHPAVADCAVIGVPDEEWGERVVAIVEARATVTPSELIAFCREHLAHDKCPREVELVERLPRDPAGKIRKRDLRDPSWRAGRT